MAKKKILINLLGGPCCGKSALARILTNDLNALRIPTEMTGEFVKLSVIAGDKDLQRDDILNLAMQRRLIETCAKVSEVIVCDSPVALVKEYGSGKYYSEALADLADDIIYEHKHMFETFNVLCTPIEQYQPAGRVQKNAEEALKVHESIKDIAGDDVDFVYDGNDDDSYNYLFVAIEELIKKLEYREDLEGEQLTVGVPTEVVRLVEDAPAPDTRPLKARSKIPGDPETGKYVVRLTGMQDNFRATVNAIPHIHNVMKDACYDFKSLLVTDKIPVPDEVDSRVVITSVYLKKCDDGAVRAYVDLDFTEESDRQTSISADVTATTVYRTRIENIPAIEYVYRSPLFYDDVVIGAGSGYLDTICEYARRNHFSRNKSIPKIKDFDFLEGDCDTDKYPLVRDVSKLLAQDNVPIAKLTFVKTTPPIWELMCSAAKGIAVTSEYVDNPDDVENIIAVAY